MGKHERQLIEEAEKIIVKTLNSERINIGDKKNHWFSHASTIARKIKEDFLNIDLATHLGNRYDNTGDISISCNAEIIFIETKMSDSVSGSGTRANISQDALTENGLFEGVVNSWSHFRLEKEHDKWVNEYLDRFSSYKKNVLSIINLVKQKEEKAKHLRQLAKNKNKKALSILNDIREKDRKEKLDYMAYLDTQRQKEKAIKNFFILIMLGIHDKDDLKDMLNNNNLFAEIQNLYIYYANSNKGEIIIRREDVGARIKKIVGKYSNFKIIFPKNLTHCKIVADANGKTESLLQIVFHWKNIAQGIKTPCLNIFDINHVF